jgi:hypothetical protein
VNAERKSKFWMVWVAATLTVAAALIGLLTLANSLTQKPVVVSVDSNGVARAAGIPLSDTNVRDGVFRAMGAARLKGSFLAAGITNQTQASNAFEILKSMSRAGLFTTNQAAPNPYE